MTTSVNQGVIVRRDLCPKRSAVLEATAPLHLLLSHVLLVSCVQTAPLALIHALLHSTVLQPPRKLRASKARTVRKDHHKKLSAPKGFTVQHRQHKSNVNLVPTVKLEPRQRFLVKRDISALLLTPK